MVRDQIRSVLKDFSPAAIKIGMVYDKATIDVVTDSLKETDAHVVLDPILAAGTGAALLREDAFEPLVSSLLPICELVTPNRTEAERLAGKKIRTEQDAIYAAKKIKKLGAKNVVVKGGHFGASEVTDILVDAAARVRRIKNPRIDIEQSHGSGCNFSAAVSAFLAKGIELEEACLRANEYVHYAIVNVIKVGRGLPVTNPLSSIYRDAMKYRVVEDLQHAVEEINRMAKFHVLIPETQTNFVYALPEASKVSEVAGVRGRIVKIGNTAVPASFIEFGASTHMASAVLACMAVRPSLRAAINIRYNDRLEGLCRNLFEVSSYNRKKEPTTIKQKEGSTMSWGIRSALKKNPKADVIYHRGDIGKEPMIDIFGNAPSEVVEKIRRLLKYYE